MSKTALVGATLHAIATELSDDPTEAIGALTSALGAMIVTCAKDGSREHALKACELAAKMLHEGTNLYFDNRERDGASLQ